MVVMPTEIGMKIRVFDVEKVYSNGNGKDMIAITGVNLDVMDGEFICLVGPSGCGKTTLMNMMAGFDHPSRGEITIDDERVTGTNPKFITIFQDHSLFPWRTVLGNVEYGLEAKKVPKREREEIARRYIKMVGLENFASSHPQELSGGMKQRAAIARAMAVDPEILFMDEPFAALDAITRMNMEDEIMRLWQEKRQTVIFVTHDIDEAIYLGDRIAIMSPHPGKIKAVFPIDLSRPRDRTSSDFSRIRERIYREFGYHQNIKSSDI